MNADYTCPWCGDACRTIVPGYGQYDVRCRKYVDIGDVVITVGPDGVAAVPGLEAAKVAEKALRLLSEV